MKRTRVAKKEQWLVERAAESGAALEILNRLYWSSEIEFSLTELANAAQVAKSTASRILYSLKEAGLVTVEDKGTAYRIKANRENPRFVNGKIAYNLKYLFDSGLVEFLDKHYKHPRAIVLFGSYRKGEDISTSDIDIAIETGREIELETDRPAGIEEFERHFPGRKLQIHLFNRKKVDINLFNNIANGIVLSGFLEVKP